MSTFIGLKFAERIVPPLSSVIKATNNISKGSYDDKIKKTNDYIELNRLADSFNKMSNDIVRQRKQILISKKHETWSDIARKMAHEIKNPLTPIQLSSERLEKIGQADINNNEIEECLDTIRRSSRNRLSSDEFSNFARLPEPRLFKTDVISIINDIINIYKNNYKNINFKLDLNKNFFELNVDKSQISRVFQNLLINSIHSIESNNGNVYIKSLIKNNYFIICIIDNGIGLKYEKDELIKPYFTTKKERVVQGLVLQL